MPDPILASVSAALSAPAAETFRRELAEKITQMGEPAGHIRVPPVRLPTVAELDRPYLRRRPDAG